MNFPNFQLTSAGVDAIMQAVYNGSTITFTAVKIGDGTAPSNIKAMTDIVHTKATASFTSIDIDDGVANLDFTFNNSTIASGFYLRELGIMAKVDNGNPVLYAYSNSGSNAGYLKPYASDSYVNMVFSIYVAVGDAEHVTAIISEAVGYVTTEQFEVHTGNSTNPHNVTKQQVGLGNVPNLAPSDMTINFTKASTLTAPTSGSKLSILIGLLAKAIDSLIAHLTDSNNPHSTTYAQIGAAAASHTHTYAQVSGVAAANHTHSLSSLGAAAANHTHTLASLGAAAASHNHDASNIISGTFPVERGGTGVQSYDALSIAICATVAETKTYLEIT